MALIAAGAASLVALSACSEDAAPSQPVPTASTARSADAPFASTPPSTAGEADAPAPRTGRTSVWATQVCAAAQGLLDAHTYGEPYGMPIEDLSLEQLQQHSAAMTEKVVPAALTAALTLRGIPPAEAGARAYQDALREAFERFADVYADRADAVRSATSADDVADIDQETLARVSDVLRAIEAAYEALPAETQTAVDQVGGCRLLS